MHHRLVVLMTLASALAVPSAFAAEPAPKREPTAQQLRMKDCNAEAKLKALKGDPRKQFMRACLKGKRAD